SAGPFARPSTDGRGAGGRQRPGNDARPTPSLVALGPDRVFRQARTDAPRPGRSDPPMSLGATHALDASVLVLNKFYMAVHVISVRRAFCLLFKDLAEVVTLDDGRYLSFDFQSWREVSEARKLFQDPDDEFIRTVSFEIQVPRIIRLLTYDRLPRAKV